MPTKIWILDHNHNLWGRVVDTLEDEGLRKFSNAVVWHGYAGTPDMMSRVHEAYRGAEMHWTEGGPDYTDPSYLTDWCKWGRIFSGMLGNWCSSITSSNPALDERGQPTIGPFSCGGVVTIDSQSKEITRSGQYGAFAHYSRVVGRGAWRFNSLSSTVELQHAGFENPDGQQVLVVTNAGAARAIALRLASMGGSNSIEGEFANHFDLAAGGTRFRRNLEFLRRCPCVGISLARAGGLGSEPPQISPGGEQGLKVALQPARNHKAIESPPRTARRAWVELLTEWPQNG